MSEAQRRLAAIMFTDIVGYSALMQQNEAQTLALLDEHRQVLRPLFLTHHGREVETIGDAFFVEFPSALHGVRCAIAIQQTLHERNTLLPREQQIRLRIGLHVGDVVHMGDHVHGDKVNIAARIQPLAEPEGICLSEDMARQIHNQIALPLRKLGRAELKHITLPMELYRIVMPWEQPRGAWSERLQFGLRRTRTRRMLGGSLGVVLGLLGMVAGWHSWERAQVQKPETKDTYRIAVLPFVNLSGDEKEEYFSDGMTEEMIAQLGKIRGVEIIARTSMMAYKGTKKTIEEIGRELQAGTVLEGSVRKAENRVRVTTQLINVQRQAPLWRHDYDRELTGIFAIQSDIAHHVADALAVKVLARETPRREPQRTAHVDAYDLYLQGLYHWHKQTKDGLAKGKGYFEQAIAHDPTYAPAYAWLAIAYDFLGAYGHLPTKEAYPKAQAAARKALELDETIAEAHAVLAWVQLTTDWDWPRAERAYKRAMQLNPNSTLAHNYYGIVYLAPLGRSEEAIAALRRCLELDPLSVQFHHDLGWAFVYARQYDRALAQFQKAIEMEPTFDQAYFGLGEAYLGQGLHAQALTALQTMVDLTDASPYALRALGWAYGVTGKHDEARQVLATLHQRAQHERIDPTDFALIYAGLREKAHAFAWLHKAYEERAGSWMLIWLKVGPWYDPLRSDPLFTELLRKVGLAP
jgi:TolB-like protein/class 3 adenylate cyclase/tetratricopeptide (TPR) repeat protein